MPDYRRLVSYMYNYENGLKRNNVGYARIEARNGQCKYTLHITAPSLNERHLKAYMFMRREGGLQGILLGTLIIRNGIGELKGQTESENLMNSSYSLNDIGGIIIYLSDTKFFGTEWDDQPLNKEAVSTIEADNSLEETVPINYSEPEESMPDSGRNEERDRWEDENTKKYEDSTPEPKTLDDEEEDVKAEVEEDKVEAEAEKVIVEAEVDKDKVEEVKSHEESSLQQQEQQSQPLQEPDTWEEPEINLEKYVFDLTTSPAIEAINLHTPHSIIKNSNENRKRVENPEKIYWTHEIIPQKVDENQEDNEKIEEDVKEEPVKMESQVSLDKEPEDDRCNNSNEICGFHYTNGCRPTEELQRFIYEDHPLAKRLYKEFPRMFPFEDNEIAWCVRIEPQDIGMLPMETWGLGNNSFLLHGYYSYRHLIFARINYKNGYYYIIGVPGIYHNREKFMAKMFGFENFKCVKNRERKTGEFGYWYIPVLIN